MKFENSTYSFAFVKKMLLNILTFLLLLTVSVETTSAIWLHDKVSVILMEKEEKSNATENDTEKEESKDKIFQWLSLQQQFNNDRSFFVLSHIYFKYSAYLSLPEIPPDQV